jgi:hypothetical protein
VRRGDELYQMEKITNRIEKLTYHLIYLVTSIMVLMIISFIISNNDLESLSHFEGFIG